MATGLLDGFRVLDLCGEPGALAGRVLADLGAEVVVVEPSTGHPDRSVGHRFDAWGAGKRSVVVEGPDDPALDALLAAADVVLDTPGFPGALTLDPGRAPDAVWVSITPFGRTGPRAGWHASDLGVMAASGNMFATGDPDRAPVRCTEPSGYAHAGPRGRVRRAHRAVDGLPAPRRRLDAGGRLRREHDHPRGLPVDRVPRPAARRGDRPHARDLADEGRLRVVRAARRQGTRAEPRDASRASSPRTASPARRR